jgi:chromosome segregation ATPase
MILSMRKFCLSILRQGWLGVPIFLIGLVSLAYSQFAQDEKVQALSADDLSQSVGKSLGDIKGRLFELNQKASANAFSAKEESIRRNLSQVEDAGEKDRVISNLNAVSEAWKLRVEDIIKGSSSVEGRLQEAENIYADLEDNFAGRLEEAMPALEVVQENLTRTIVELDALEKLLSNAANDAVSGFNTLIRESEFSQVADNTPPVPVAPRPSPVTETGRNLSAVIQATEAVPLNGDRRFGSSINRESGEVLSANQLNSDMSDDMIRKLKMELENSKSMQTELSTDTANLQSDLRKAYREIVSLQTSLRESEIMVDELEKTKDSLWKTSDGRLPSADTVSKQITQLQKDLELTRSDLRQSRQSLLLEQERSNSMIRSITSELDRTRRQLDEARVAAVSSGADSGRLLLLERELTQTKRALQMARNAPGDSSSETYLNLQDELRKAMGEIARMQVELGQKNDLEKQLLQLRSSLEEVGDSPSRSASPAYVNKLLIDLNAAKREVAKAKASNQQERRELAERVITLENELQATQIELEKTTLEFANTKESIAKREFEFATTIKKLEEDAQLAQEALGKASLGQLPAIPFVNEMEENLADSEARMQSLAERFDAEQARASEVIDGLQMELDSALIRQKQAINELNIREKTLGGKDKEIAQLREEKKKLQEELDVVKVIAGQLNDLNEILEETKDTQNSQTGSMDMVVSSLRDELNKAKVELVFALEENDKLQQEGSLKIISLEQQLDDARAQLMMEEDNLVEQARDSKDLMIELKSELDAAREEIARMKTAGLGDSVETRQAVSQLQEALGTIRVLQESLNEAESVNLEVDNLRSELANAMSTQLNELQKSEDEKISLQQKVNGLEAEIEILREQGSESGLAQKQMVADLKVKLASTEALVSDLELRLSDSEGLGITSLVALEDELSKARLQNEELLKELDNNQDTKTRTVELLEKELANAMNQLDQLENRNDSSELNELRIENQKLLERIQSKDASMIVSDVERNLSTLREELADKDKSDQTILELEAKLEDAIQELSKLEGITDNQGEYSPLGENGEALSKLEEELASAEGTIMQLQSKLLDQDAKSQELFEELSLATRKVSEMEKLMSGQEPDAMVLNPSVSGFAELEEELAASKLLTAQLREKNEQEKKQRELIEKRLSTALNNLNSIEGGLANPNSLEDKSLVAELQTLLREKDGMIENLEGKLTFAVEEITNKEAELELAKAMQETGDLSGAKPDREVVNALQGEIDLLKGALEELRLESENGSLQGAEMKSLQLQLQDAVAESMETQMELVETKQKLAELEQSSNSNSSDEQIRTFVAQAKESEKEAQDRIDELTAALRDSETLRKEIETVLMESADAQTKQTPMNEDPRIVDLQNELVLLQQDLLNARNLQDPIVPQLQSELSASREDSVRLNEEFKNAMQDFGRIKEQLEILEAENRKLNEISLTQARDEAGQANANLRSELNQSLSEISNLKNQIVDRDQRVQNLTEQLAIAETTRPGISPDNSALRAQIIRLQGLFQAATDRESQANLQVQRLNQELANTGRKMAALEDANRQAQSLNRGVPSRLGSLSGLTTQSTQLSPVQMAELNSLREQNKRLQEQFRSLENAPGRSDLDRRIQDLNQKNLTAQIQLDQERSRVQDLRKQLSEARGIKQEIVERGQSANLKVDLLNDELEDARGRIGSLEKALIAAREAIRVLQRGGNGSSTVKVSIPGSSFSNLNSSGRNNSNFPSAYSGTPNRYTPSMQPSSQFNRMRPNSSPLSSLNRSSSTPISQSSLSAPVVQKVPSGQSTMQLKAEVQFLNNKKRPAGFTEFFLVRNSLDSIMESARIRIPPNEGISSFAEFWARAVQRGYRFPGVAAAIRNALARASLTRLKTNSIGVANVDNLEGGSYFVIGASTLGQVGVVWSKQVSLQGGENQISLDLRDASWAQ